MASRQVGNFTVNEVGAVEVSPRERRGWTPDDVLPVAVDPEDFYNATGTSKVVVDLASLAKKSERINQVAAAAGVRADLTRPGVERAAAAVNTMTELSRLGRPTPPETVEAPTPRPQRAAPLTPAAQRRPSEVLAEADRK